MAGTEAALVKDLAQINTLFGRLAYLASLRRPDIGLYTYLGSVVRGARTDRYDGITILPDEITVLRVHDKVYGQWVKRSPHEKRADIDRYITGLNRTDRAELLDAWCRLKAYSDLVPDSIHGPNRLRHLLDFDLILTAMREAELELAAQNTIAAADVKVRMPAVAKTAAISPQAVCN
jgi:hypothetical protein